MKLNFEINGVAIRENEAKSLFTLSDETPSITIDLSEHLTKDCLDAKKLFNLSIKSKQPELAQLAAKLAMSTPQVKAKKKRKKITKNKTTKESLWPGMWALLNIIFYLLMADKSNIQRIFKYYV